MDSPQHSPEPAWKPPQDFAEADRQLMRLALALLVAIQVIYLLEKFSVVLQQLLIAVFVAYLLMPAHRWLVRHRMPSLLAYLLIAAVVVGAGTMLVLEVRTRVEELIANLSLYQEAFARVIKKMTGEQIEPNNVHLVLWTTTDQGDNIAQIRTLLREVVGLSTHVLVVIVYLLFILAERAGFSRRMRIAFPPDRTKPIHDAVERISGSIDQYIYVKTFVSILTGLLSGLVLWLFGVEYALLWGLLTFLLNYVPYLGALVALIPPVLLSLVQFGSIPYTLLILALLVLIQNVLGYGLEPYMAGRRVDLSPLVIIGSLAFWGSLWGMVGMILAVPMMVVIKAVLQHFPTTQPLAVLLSHHPTPAEAGVPTPPEEEDPDE